MKKVTLISVLLLFSSVASAQTTPQTPAPIASPSFSNPTMRVSEAGQIPFILEEKKYFGNSVSVPTPSTFIDADSVFIKEKFPNKGDNTPKIVMTDATKRPILALNIKKNVGDRQDVTRFFRDVKNDLRNQYPTARFFKTDVVRGRSLAIIEVILPNQDGINLYNMMAFRYVDDNFFFLNFTCPEEDMAKWQNTAREIAENVKVEFRR